MTECDRRVRQNIATCEAIEGKPLSEKDQTWIYVHVYRMMVKEKRAQAPGGVAKGVLT